MQIIITTSSSRAPIVLQLSILNFSLGLIAFLMSFLFISGLLYHAVLTHGTQMKWPILSSTIELIRNHETPQKDQFMQENLDAMAKKVGDLQARLVHMEAVNERIARMAGMKAEDFQQIEPPGGSASGAGGALPALRSTIEDIELSNGFTYTQITDLLSRLDASSNRNADVLTLIESRLFEKRLAALMLPSSRPVSGPFGSGFGFRTDPFTGQAALHTGLDFPSPMGTPIFAAAGGVVMTAQSHPQYGQMVEIDHGNSLVTRYAHASRILVKTGDLVKRGQSIAEVGSTGRSTGPHLHFEVLVEGVQQNPAKFLSLQEAPVLSAMSPIAK